ncbi:XRE family transcriptional regulator [Rathayibacter sp. VKM Ac-2803]|uniref:XRE family transcriptional regulator n=1 Tax=Rathayibacter sp. VKM Ac-2803 TaxID=2609256 RepID=UPI00135B76BB|nr:XRE family transcriptional regulator [Rathayibacter sp. VKM Ac-2803]MWV49429.1 XRE family transcriptional regulator [Rathayibacter sp. VKM Ac-2803]
MAQHHFTATAVRDGRWWLVTILELDTVGQARSVGEVSAVAVEVAALFLGVPEEDVAVAVTVHITPEAEELWREAEAAERESREAQERSASARRRAVAIARADKYSLDAAAAAFGVSRTRVQQLERAATAS